MRPKAIIVPAILTNSQTVFKQQLKRLGGLAKRIQIDIIDGRFVANKTLALADLKTIKDLVNYELDVHLMVQEPINYLFSCQQLGVSRVVAHIEQMTDQFQFVQQALDLGLKPGLALDLDTELETVEPGFLTSVDQILLMAVKVGFSGQQQNKKIFPKIKALRQLAPELSEIGIDGGINDTNLKALITAGANVLNVTSFLWTGEVKTRLNRLRSLINEV